MGEVGTWKKTKKWHEWQSEQTKYYVRWMGEASMRRYHTIRTIGEVEQTGEDGEVGSFNESRSGLEWIRNDWEVGVCVGMVSFFAHHRGMGDNQRYVWSEFEELERELVREDSWVRAEEMADHHRSMAGAPGSTAPETNVAIRIVDEIDISEGLHNGNHIHAKIQDAASKTEGSNGATVPVEVPRMNPSKLIPPPSAPPSTAIRVETQERTEERRPTQANTQEAIDPANGDRGGGESGEGAERERKSIMELSIIAKDRHVHL